jgi:uncharacterized protein YraI
MDYKGRVRRCIFLSSAVVLLALGCERPVSNNAITPESLLVTMTMPPSAIPAPAETYAPPTLAQTVAPLEGTTSAQLNVRSEPSTAGSSLGSIGPFERIQIIGKDASGTWYQILDSQSPDGRGWVSAQYVEVKDKAAVPVVGGAAGSGPTGLVTQQVNVRAGPGTGFEALGTLNPNDVVTLTGKDAKTVWLQIEFANGPDGRGWVTAAYVQASGIEALPIMDQSNEVTGTVTPSLVQPTITPTVIPAPSDGDSAQSPAASVTFSPAGPRLLIYSSDISAPQGDGEDWVGFTPYDRFVTISLSCLGNGVPTLELRQNEKSLQGLGGLACGETRQLDLEPAQAYLIRLSVNPAGGALDYVHYILKIEASR